jgi:hypothetical protein
VSIDVKITKWDPKAVKAFVTDILLENGEIVGKFVETDARRRLRGIDYPEWGKKYRQKLVARLITYLIEKGNNEVVITVGVKESKGQRFHGYYIELGSKTAPANPFLRPAVFNNGSKIVKLLAEATQRRKRRQERKEQRQKEGPKTPAPKKEEPVYESFELPGGVKVRRK